MPVAIVRTVNFGRSKRDLSTVGYTVVRANGTIETQRTTDGVYQVLPGSGIYAVNATVPDAFSGTIAWDTGDDAAAAYAVEEFDVATRVSFVQDVEEGRWRILPETNEMVFYKPDNSTELMRFELRDNNNNPSIATVFTRVRK